MFPTICLFVLPSGQCRLQSDIRVWRFQRHCFVSHPSFSPDYVMKVTRGHLATFRLKIRTIHSFTHLFSVPLESQTVHFHRYFEAFVLVVILSHMINAVLNGVECFSKSMKQLYTFSPFRFTFSASSLKLIFAVSSFSHSWNLPALQLSMLCLIVLFPMGCCAMINDKTTCP